MESNRSALPASLAPSPDIPTLDGKALRGARKKDEDGSDYLLSLYDMEQAKVLSQVAVDRKENEITKAP